MMTIPFTIPQSFKNCLYYLICPIYFLVFKVSSRYYKRIISWSWSGYTLSEIHARWM